MAAGVIVDGFVVAFTVGFAVPLDGDGEHAALGGEAGVGAGVAGGETAASEVGTGGGVDVVIGDDYHGQTAGGFADGIGDEDAGGELFFDDQIEEFAVPGGVSQFLDETGGRGGFGEIGGAEGGEPIVIGQGRGGGGRMVLELGEELGIGRGGFGGGLDRAGEAETGEWAGEMGGAATEEAFVPLGGAGEIAATADYFFKAGGRAEGVAGSVSDRGGGVPVFAPFPDVAGHIVEAEFIGGKLGDGAGGFAKEGGVLVTGGAEGLIGGCTEGAGPFGGGGKAVAGAVGDALIAYVARGEIFGGGEAVDEIDGIVPSDVFDGVGGVAVMGGIGAGETGVFGLGDFGFGEKEGAGGGAGGDGKEGGGEED